MFVFINLASGFGPEGRVWFRGGDLCRRSRTVGREITGAAWASHSPTVRPALALGRRFKESVCGSFSQKRLGHGDPSGKSGLAHADEVAVVLAGQRPQERPQVGALVEEAQAVDLHPGLLRLRLVPVVLEQVADVPAEDLALVGLLQRPRLLDGQA